MRKERQRFNTENCKAGLSCKCAFSQIFKMHHIYSTEYKNCIFFNYLFPLGNGTMQSLHLLKFTKEPQDIEQHVQQTLTKAYYGVLTIRNSVMAHLSRRWARESGRGMRSTLNVVVPQGIMCFKGIKPTNNTERNAPCCNYSTGIAKWSHPPDSAVTTFIEAVIMALFSPSI